MANKALATRQKMQFRVEPSQIPARLKNQRGAGTIPAYLRQKPVKEVRQTKSDSDTSAASSTKPNGNDNV
ncbi:hypothetical protein ACO0KY_00550 [Undibacterium sp. Dicai25W]|uniref:hypothetical protein n=1 Tax=Undibacterium sp. Dicai25W TaxID=3413034 RepID=UPI003BF36096